MLDARPCPESLYILLGHSSSSNNSNKRQPGYWIFFCPAPFTQVPDRGTTCGMDRKGAQSNMNSFSPPSRQRVSHTLQRIMWYAKTASQWSAAQRGHASFTYRLQEGQRQTMRKMQRNLK